jgi:hypothetical protein
VSDPARTADIATTGAAPSAIAATDAHAHTSGTSTTGTVTVATRPHTLSAWNIHA